MAGVDVELQSLLNEKHLFLDCLGCRSSHLRDPDAKLPRKEMVAMAMLARVECVTNFVSLPFLYFMGIDRSMGKWRAHVVLVPFFSPSHSMPFFDFAIRLAASAVKVTILSAEYHVSKVWSDALYARWAPRLRALGDVIELVPVRDGMYDGTWEGFRTVVVREESTPHLIAAFAAHLAPLMISSATPPCCVISDMLIGFAQGLAAQFHLPRYVLYIQPASNLSILLHVPNLIAQGRLPLAEDDRTQPMEVPGFRFPVHPSDLPMELEDRDVFKWGIFDSYLRMSRRVREAPIVLINTFREFEEDVFVAFDADRQLPKVIPIGPLLLPDDFPSLAGTVTEAEIGEESSSLMQWLDKQPPRSVLYVSFGTLVNNTRQQMEEIAFGLEASQQPFLWAAATSIKHPNEPPPPRVSEVLPPGFEERTRERGKVATAVVPQLRILQHPACGAFLSHCGWNAVLESVSSGVPIIAWPRQFEQRMTARFLVDSAKVAAELAEVRRGFVARDEMQRVVRLVMHPAEGAALRSRAAELKQFAARSAYSNTNLDTFLAGITQMTNRPTGA